MLPHRLRCLGTPHLSGPDGEPVRFRTRKHLALLVYLANVSPAPQRRDKLAAMLWPRADLDEARHSLATALSVLRGRLGADAFEGTRDTVRLLPGRVDTDVAALLSGDPLERDVIGSAGFLEEFEVPDAVEFSHWVDRERARLLPLIHAQLARRITHCRRTGDSRTMERLAEQLWRVDPLSEEAARAILEARAMAGDRISGLRAFDRWKRELAEQLGAVPSLEVERIADRLRRHALERHTTTVIAPVPAEQWRERPFVGRGIEFEACYRDWQVVRTGAPRHVILLGDDGVGKSTIAGRVVTTLALEGASVARLQCHELERELPFGVAGSMVEQLIDLPGAAATPPEQLAELARLVAKVRQRWPGLPAPSNATGESARIQFTEAVMALIAALAAEQPVVIVIDDLHLSDAASLAVLHLALRRIESEPVMALLTMTGAPGDLPPEAGRFALRPEGIRATVHTVGPLPEAHAAELLELLLAGNADPGPSVRRALLAGAQGNPMVLELLLDDWRRRGEDSLALATGAMTRPGAAAPAEACQSLVAAMLGALDQETRAVADLGAVLGRRLNDLGMYRLLDLSVARTMRAMTNLTSLRVLRDAGTHLEFVNAAVRGELYQSMASPLRRILHVHVADALLAAKEIDRLEVAWHLVRGDRLAEAIPHLLAGGQDAIRRGAPHEADLALSTGLAHLTGRDACRAALLLAEAKQELGCWADSLIVLSEHKNGTEETEDSYLGEVLTIAAYKWLGRLSPSDADASTARLIQILQATESSSVKVQALSTAVKLLTVTRNSNHLESLDRILRAGHIAAKDRYEGLHLSLTHAWIACSQGRLKEALAELDAGIAVATEFGYRSTLAARLQLGKGNLLAVLGHYAEAREPLHAAHAIAETLDNRGLRAECATQLATVSGRLGDSHEQMTWAQRAIDCFPHNDVSPGAFGARYELGLGLLGCGRDLEAKEVASLLVKGASAHLPAWLAQASRLYAADIFALGGHPRRALNAAKSALDHANGQLTDPSLAGLFARWCALIALQSGDPKTGLQVLDRTLPNVSTLHRKDRVELLLARAILGASAGSPPEIPPMQVASEVRSLPRGISSYLRKLGFTEGDGLQA